MTQETSRLKTGFIVILFVWFAYGFNHALAEKVTTIRANGDPSNRVDMVILGDGYKESELGKYIADVDNLVVGFFNQEPFKTYKNYFNVHRVDVVSNESGVDHPENSPPVYKDNAFDSTYNCYNIQRLICANTSKVYNVLDSAVAPDQRDIVLVIVNDPVYGGSGGAIAVASTNSAVIELVLHEIGHSFGLLADEYDYGTCNDTYEPSEVNVTKETDRNLLKWNVGGGPPNGWVEPDTPVPTIPTAPGVPGLYEGADHCPSNLYRPSFNSKMRNLNVPFEQINEEQLIKRIHNWVSPLDDSEPIDGALVIRFGRVQDFAVVVPTPSAHELEISWYLDGQFHETGGQFTIDTRNLSLGAHIVDVEVWDQTEKVRFDPASVLSDQRSWTVQIYLLGDFGEDGDVDGSDLFDFANEYNKKKLAIDLNGDGFLDELDVGEFALDFGIIKK